MATDKNEQAFRTIGEVAESLDLPPHVLRFWESRFKELEPVKRAGGRRYYRPRDVELVMALRHLLYGQGYTIKGVQRILKEQGVRAVIDGLRAGTFRPGFSGVEPEVEAHSPAPAAPASHPARIEPPDLDLAPEAAFEAPPAAQLPALIAQPAPETGELSSSSSLRHFRPSRRRAAAGLWETRRH